MRTRLGHSLGSACDPPRRGGLEAAGPGMSHLLVCVRVCVCVCVCVYVCVCIYIFASIISLIEAKVLGIWTLSIWIIASVHRLHVVC